MTAFGFVGCILFFNILTFYLASILTYFLAFYLASVQAFILAFYVGIYSDNLSGILAGILFDILFGMSRVEACSTASGAGEEMKKLHLS